MEKELNKLGQQNQKIKDYLTEGPFEDGDLVRLDGQVYRAVNCDTGYTIKQYFSHQTPEKGPGPGWDSRFAVLKKYGVTSPEELPDEPYFTIELESVEE